MYDITRRETFLHLDTWLQDAVENGNPDMVIVLVGNKTDLESRRNVSYEEGARFANENNLVFVETSAKTANNVEEAFVNCAEEVMKKIRNGSIDLSSETSGVRVGPNALVEQ